jgi:hypothetical protein
LHLRLCVDSTGHWYAVWARPLDCRLGCRVTNLVAVKIVGRAFATSTFGTPRGARRYSVRRDGVKRLTDLERENVTLMRFLADAELQRVALKEIAKGNV